VTSPEEELEQKLAALKTRFAERLPLRLEALDQALQGLGASDAGEAMAALKALRNEAHKLSGTAGTFGFETLGLAAQALEEFCDPLIAAGHPITQEERRTLGARLADLKKSVG
jgi:chemotaxis protein histidine kinase CheA